MQDVLSNHYKGITVLSRGKVVLRQPGLYVFDLSILPIIIHTYIYNQSQT